MSKQESDRMDAIDRSDVRTYRLSWLFKTAHNLASRLSHRTNSVSDARVSESSEDPADTHGRLHFQIQSEADCDDNQVELQLVQQGSGDRMKISIKYIDENAVVSEFNAHH